MKISEIVERLMELKKEHGDLELILVSEHNGPQKARGADVTYVEDISEHYLEEVAESDLEDEHVKVIVAYT